jgi:hypothetical protein
VPELALASGDITKPKKVLRRISGDWSTPAFFPLVA